MATTRKRVLWWTFVFILIVFAFATPFDASKASRDFSSIGVSLEDFVKAINEGSLQRRIALVTLALFGSLCLVKPMSVRSKANGMLSWLMAVYLFMTVLSIGWADDPWLTARRVTILITLILGALGLARILSVGEIISLGLSITVVTLAASISAEIYFGTFSIYSESWRFAGLLHPIDQGWNCGIMSITSVAKLKGSGRKTLYYCSLVIAMIFLLLTKSRVPFVATLLAIIVYWIFWSDRSGKTFAIMAVCFLSILAYFVLDDYLERVYGVMKAFGRGEEGEGSLGTLTGRLPLWRECLHMISLRPILGYGYSSYLTPSHLKSITAAVGFTPSSPHSGYIDILFSLGITGFVIYISVLALALKKSVELVYTNREYIFAVAMLVWLCSNLVFEANLIDRPIFPNFYCLILLVKIGFYSQDGLVRQSLRHKA